MGEVYRAEDLKLGQTVALKCLPAGLARDANRLERLLTEVRVARQVSHPNVCRVYDVVEVEGRHFLTMEWIEGRDLGAVLREGARIPADRALVLARQICAGLAAAHERGVIHRDLKPSNVMLDERGVARITDFGLAEAAPILRGRKVREGTPGYMAPEQLAGGEVTAKSDLYALGLVLHEILTGRPAFAGDTLEALLRARTEPPVPPTRLAGGLDPAVDAAVLRCLDHDPARRPASAREVEEALPGPGRLDEALAAAQRRADRIAAFRAEMGELRRAGILRVGDEEINAIDRYHRALLQDLVAHFDVDVGERSKFLSLGMRMVSLIGAFALAASVFYFFYSIWGSMAAVLQITVLAGAPLAGLLITGLIARREPGGYFTTIAAVVAICCFLLNTVMLGGLFNMRSSPATLLLWGLFALVIAYGFELRLPLALGAAFLAGFVAGTCQAWAGGYWEELAARPETWLPAGALCLVLPRLRPRLHPPGFRPIYRVLGGALLLSPSLFLGTHGNLSYLPYDVKSLEIGYQILGFVGGAGALAAGIARRSKEAAYGGAIFLFVWMLVELVEWFWEWIPRSLFFLAVALAAIGALFLLKRLRAAVTALPEERA